MTLTTSQSTSLKFPSSSPVKPELEKQLNNWIQEINLKMLRDYYGPVALRSKTNMQNYNDTCAANDDYENESMGEELFNLKKNHLGAVTERFIELAEKQGENKYLAKQNDLFKRANEDLIQRLRNAEARTAELERSAKRDYETITSLRNSWYTLSENYRKYREKQKKAATK